MSELTPEVITRLREVCERDLSDGPYTFHPDHGEVLDDHNDIVIEAGDADVLDAITQLLNHLRALLAAAEALEELREKWTATQAECDGAHDDENECCCVTAERELESALARIFGTEE